MFRSLVLALAFVASGCGAAMAQAAAPPSAVASPPAAPSQRALELSHKLMEATHIGDQMRRLMASMMPMMVDQSIKQIPEFKPEWRQALIDANQEAMDDWFPGYLTKAETLYAQTFTEDELAQAVTFYESPSGRAMITKSPALIPGLTALVKDAIQPLQLDTQARFCRKTNACNKPAAPNQTTAG